MTHREEHRSLFKRAALGLVSAYTHGIGPLLPHACRFHPSCSRYTHEAIDKFGVWQGSYLGAKRILKCHPWHEGGFDPVPDFLPHSHSTDK